MTLRKLSEVFGLTSEKSWNSYLFNTTENMNYVVPEPDITCCGVDQMHELERKEFLSQYETFLRMYVFDKRRVLERYCQADFLCYVRRVERIVDTC
jgi:hypothetical protein